MHPLWNVCWLIIVCVVILIIVSVSIQSYINYRYCNSHFVDACKYFINENSFVYLHNKKRKTISRVKKAVVSEDFAVVKENNGQCTTVTVERLESLYHHGYRLKDSKYNLYCTNYALCSNENVIWWGICQLFKPRH